MAKTVTTNEGTRGMGGYQSSTSIAVPVLTPDRIEKRQNGRRFKNNGEPAFTLTAQDRHGVGVEVKVNEATKQGYAVARGGGWTPSTSRCREAKPDAEESG